MRREHLGVGRVGPREKQVLPDGLVEQMGVLGHNTHLVANRCECRVAQVHAVYSYRT